MSVNDAENSLEGGATYGGAANRQQGEDKSLGGEATFAGQGRRQRDDVSLGDERTLGGDVSDLDTAMDDIEIVDLASRYRTEGTLGRGGMGEVLLATDTRLDRKVAIKRILGEAARSRTAVSRFLTEAKSIAALNHPNIVQIYDYGRAADGPFLIMEYVDGNSLLDRCRGEAIPLDEAVELACQLCDGLAKAHDLGIIHRDIKPANVLLTKDGTPKLTDFGLAKAEAKDHGQTMTGAVLGTPDFMPPEQRRDAALVDARSDLWSLAASVYQMVTGKSPKIIRFKDVPEAIQEVLGRALEDEKDARYQTVREFRDALKVSLRAAAAPAVVSLGEGQCPGCGTKNDSSRKFCRNCGGSLEAPCLSCDKGMPYWEEICGQCGTKQEPLIAERLSAMAARQAAAESFLNDLEFEAADRIAVALHGEKDPRFNQFAGWAENFLPRIQRSRDEQRIRAAALLTEALRHEQAFDYLSAIHALEQVPGTLRSEILPDSDTSVANMLQRVMGKQADCERLEAKIKSAITARELGSLMPDVESFLRLKPDRKDVQKVKAQLEERHTKLVTQRDDAIANAKGLIDKHEYPAAVAALTVIDHSVENVECVKVRERAEGLLRQVQQLRGKIKQAVAEKRLDGLLANVDVLLKLLPGNAEAQKLKDSLIVREEKIEADLAGHRENVDVAWQACRFAEAIRGLERIPDTRRNADDVARLDAASDLAAWQTVAGTAAAAASSLDEFATAIDQQRRYKALLDEQALDDPMAREELIRCEREHARCKSEFEQTERLRQNTRIAMAAGIAVVALIGIGTAGLWVRSSLRAQALTTAITQGRWDDALALEPRNVAALLGRSQARTAATPPDIAGAFRDIDAAEAIDSSSQLFLKSKASALAARAVDHANVGRVAEAEKDYSAAKTLCSECPPVRVAADAMMATMLTRAERAMEAKDVSSMRVACNTASRLGLPRERLSDLWWQCGKQAAQRGEIAVLSVARAEGEKYGVTKSDADGLWLLCAEACADRLDATGLATVVERGSLGSDAVAQAWLRFGRQAAGKIEIAAMQVACEHVPPKDTVDLWLLFAEQAATAGDPSLLATACGKAEMLGVPATRLVSFKSRQLMLEASEGHSKGDTSSAVDIWTKAFMLAFDAGEYGIAYKAYKSISEVNETKATELKDVLNRANPVTLVKRFPEVSKAIGLTTIVERFEQPSSDLYSRNGDPSVNGVGSEEGVTFFRMTSGHENVISRREPYALYFPVPFTATNDETVEVSFRCRRFVRTPEGEKSFLAIEFVDSKADVNAALAGDRLGQRVTIYNNDRFSLQLSGHAVIGVQQIQEGRTTGGSDAHAPCNNEEEWMTVSLWLHRSTVKQAPVIGLWTFVNGVRPNDLLGGGTASVPLMPRVLVGDKGEHLPEQLGVCLIAYGSKAINSFGQREPVLGEAKGCIYDIADVAFRIIEPPTSAAGTMEKCLLPK